MSTYLTADRFGTPTNAKKYTLAVWFKLSKTRNNEILSYNYGNGQRGIQIAVRNNDSTLRVNDFTAGVGDVYDVRTNRVFKDFSAWYHLVVAYDSTQGTAADRVKIYVNGVQESSFAVSSYPSQDADSFISATPNNNKGFILGASYNSSGSIDAGNYFSGYMSQYIFVDGTAYAASNFGSTNANGVWVPITTPSVTYGTNGFKLDFADSGASAAASNFGADSSGNNNHFTSNGLGTYPNTSDTPANNFATLDPNNDRTQGGFTFSDGNTKVTTSGSNRNYACLNQAFTSGKWYMECRFTAGASNGYVGFCDMSDLQMTGTSTLGDLSNEARVNSDGSYEKNNSTTSGWAASFTDNDILGLALDCDNNRFTISKNGQFADGSGNYDEANPTAYITYTTGNFMTLAFGEGAGAATATIEINTGNSPYTIASANADANGHGNFEYAVPSGYYALCSKNLGLYGG